MKAYNFHWTWREEAYYVRDYNDFERVIPPAIYCYTVVLIAPNLEEAKRLFFEKRNSESFDISREGNLEYTETEFKASTAILYSDKKTQ